jgi:hypothetical protein
MSRREGLHAAVRLFSTVFSPTGCLCGCNPFNYQAPDDAGARKSADAGSSPAAAAAPAGERKLNVPAIVSLVVACSAVVLASAWCARRELAAGIVVVAAIACGPLPRALMTSTATSADRPGSLNSAPSGMGGVDVRDRDGRTKLHYALAAKAAGASKDLLDNGRRIYCTPIGTWPPMLRCPAVAGSAAVAAAAPTPHRRLS